MRRRLRRPTSPWPRSTTLTKTVMLGQRKSSRKSVQLMRSWRVKTGIYLRWSEFWMGYKRCFFIYFFCLSLKCINKIKSRNVPKFICAEIWILIVLQKPTIPKRKECMCILNLHTYHNDALPILFSASLMAMSNCLRVCVDNIGMISFVLQTWNLWKRSEPTKRTKIIESSPQWWVFIILHKHKREPVQQGPHSILQ